jgi:hypothetical protein
MDDSGKHSSDHGHEGLSVLRGGLDAHPDAQPSVFSHSVTFQFDREIAGNEVITCLHDCLEDLNRWAYDNGCLVGHIKIFAENEEDLKLWVASTGREISVNKPIDCEGRRFRALCVNITAIIFGTDNESVRAVVLESLDKSMDALRSHT